MDRHQTSKKILEEKLRFAQRASVLVKTPQCKELFRLMMDDMELYNKDIIRTTPLTHEEYLGTLGRLQGLKMFIDKIKISADNKDKYAEQLKQL